MSIPSFRAGNELTFETVTAERARLSKWMSSINAKSICFSLQDVVQCDSAGLALLIHAKRMCQQQQKTLLIDAIPAKVLSLAQFCGVEAMLVSER